MKMVRQISLFLIVGGALIFTLTMLSMVWEMNGGKFLPIETPYIPFREWDAESQDFFIEGVMASMFCLGLLFLLWIGTGAVLATRAFVSLVIECIQSIRSR